MANVKVCFELDSSLAKILINLADILQGDDLYDELSDTIHYVIDEVGLYIESQIDGRKSPFLRGRDDDMDRWRNFFEKCRSIEQKIEIYNRTLT